MYDSGLWDGIKIKTAATATISALPIEISREVGLYCDFLLGTHGKTGLDLFMLSW